MDRPVKLTTSHLAAHLLGCQPVSCWFEVDGSLWVRNAENLLHYFDAPAVEDARQQLLAEMGSNSLPSQGEPCAAGYPRRKKKQEKTE